MCSFLMRLHVALFLWKKTIYMVTYYETVSVKRDKW